MKEAVEKTRVELGAPAQEVFPSEAVRRQNRRKAPDPEKRPAAPPGEWLVAGGATSRKDHIAAARMLGAALEVIAREDYDLLCEDEAAGLPVTLASISAMLATLEARQVTMKGYTDRYIDIVTPPGAPHS